jgi:hypothetical protein
MATSPDPQVWLTRVCHICTRDLVRASPATTGRTCSVCLRLDRALGRRHGAALLTPVDDAWGRGDRVVHHNLQPDDTDADQRLLDHHVRRVVSMAEAVRRSTGRTPAPRYPAGPDAARVVDLDVWRHHYPPSARASAEGYAAYVAAVHPWALQLEPLCTDVDQLTDLARYPSGG